MKKENIIFLGTSLKSQRGMAESEKMILSNWNSDRFSLHHIPTHRDGNSLTKIIFFLYGFLCFLYNLFVLKSKIVFIFVSVGASFFRKSFFIMISKIFKKKVVTYSRGGDFGSFYRKSPNYLKTYIKFVLNLVDMNVVLGSSEKFIFDEISGNSKSCIIHNSISLPNNFSTCDHLPYIVLNLGHISREKGTFDLLEAIPNVVKNCPNVMFYIGGNGDVSKALEIIRMNRIENNVKLLGYVSGKEKEDLFLKSSIFILPSYFEGMPRSLLEAMSYGLPCIASNVNGIPDLIVSGENGFLIKPGDTFDMANKIQWLIKNESVRKVMGEANRKRIFSKFNIEIKLNDLENLFEGITHGK